MDNGETGCNRILKSFYHQIALSPRFPFSLLTKRFPSGKGQFLFPFSRFFLPSRFCFPFKLVSCICDVLGIVLCVLLLAFVMSFKSFIFREDYKYLYL